jgi:superoxide dismutase, Fe-Mn family
MERSRREALVAGGALAVVAALPWRSAMAGTLDPVPLPFDPTRLAGLSERLLRSHWDNNYLGAVKNLAKTREQIAAFTKDSPPMLAAGLMERELTFRNSAQLHELYFANLGGSGGPAGHVVTALSDTFGSASRFEELFRLACSGLYGGSGWVVLAWDSRTADLRLYASGQHKETVTLGTPLLVCDMYEHAYALDFGASAAKYVDAFWLNVDWSVVDARWSKARVGAP